MAADGQPGGAGYSAVEPMTEVLIGGVVTTVRPTVVLAGVVGVDIADGLVATVSPTDALGDVGVDVADGLVTVGKAQSAT